MELMLEINCIYRPIEFSVIANFTTSGSFIAGVGGTTELFKYDYSFFCFYSSVTISGCNAPTNSTPSSGQPRIKQ
jgi:hypothetical protein